jgi:hypothetical protein
MAVCISIGRFRFRVDSSAVVTLVIHLIETGQIPKPESLTVIYVRG